MMYNRTVIMQPTGFTTAPIQPINLPVNPISHLVVTMRFLNVTDEATLAQILARIADMSVTWNGQAIFQMSAADLFRLYMRLQMNTPLGGNQVATDNAARWISLIIPFSPKLYNPAFGIPATKSGQLLFNMTPSTDQTEADNCTLMVEAVEMLGANPEKTLKMTTLTPNAPAVGDNDIILPKEGTLVGIQAFGTTVPTGTAFTKTINTIKFLMDNVERYIVQSIWEGMRGECAVTLGQEGAWKTADGAPNDDNYIYLDFDPTKDQSYCPEVQSLNDLKLTVNAGDTNPYRFNIARLVPASLYATGA